MNELLKLIKEDYLVEINGFFYKTTLHNNGDMEKLCIGMSNGNNTELPLYVEDYLPLINKVYKPHNGDYIYIYEREMV